MRTSSICLTVFAALLLGVPAVATAKKTAKEDRGYIVYGKGKALWKVPANTRKGDEATKIASLGFAARRVVAIKASSDGSAFLVSTDKNHYWVKPVAAAKNGDVKVVRHVCRGHASMSQNGMTVLCQTETGEISLESMSEGGTKKTTTIVGAMATIAKNRVTEVVVAAGSGIEAVAVAEPTTKTTLSVHAPTSHLLVAPDGKRAVAVFPDDVNGTSVFGFLLDGKGVKRKLVTDAIPVAWSSDSKWLAVTRKKRACVVRSAGGQYRCFDGYRALGMSPDNNDALLASGKQSALKISRAALGGARSSKPVLLVKRAQGAAVWLAP